MLSIDKHIKGKQIGNYIKYKMICFFCVPKNNKKFD